MVKIFIWTIFTLPAALAWLAPWLSLAASLLFWGLAGLLLRVVVFGGMRLWVSRTESDIDDIILETGKTPAWLLLMLVGVYVTLPGLGLPPALLDPVERALGVAGISVAVYWVWRLFKDVAMYYARRIVENTETSLDDVLLPIVNQLGPLVIGVGGLLLVLEYLGVRLESLLVAVGGISFILAFALQDILSNIFSGLSLVVDTPFAYRDLIVLADGTVCEVRHIGLRVTELYNVNSHSIIYVPNSQLANERLVNMTQPSPDLIDSLSVSVDANADLAQVEELLTSIAFGHPDVLGDLETKLAHLPAFESLESGEDKRANGRERLRVEQQINTRLAGILSRIDRLVARIRRVEKGGLTAAEAKSLREQFMPLLDEFGVCAYEEKTGRRKRWAVRYTSAPESLLGLVHEWITVWACDPDLGGNAETRLDVAALWEETIAEAVNDHQLLVMQWNRRMRLLIGRLSKLYARFSDPRGHEQRLDDLLLELVAWLRNNFKEPEARWKNPDVNFNGPDDKGLGFTLQFFIDDIELEHFERQDRVRRELQKEIVRRLRAAGIDMPFAQHVVMMRGPLVAPEPRKTIQDDQRPTTDDALLGQTHGEKHRTRDRFERRRTK
jgi:MscS family membrane protein